MTCKYAYNVDAGKWHYEMSQQVICLVTSQQQDLLFRIFISDIN